jgi:hypothetical protein
MVTELMTTKMLHYSHMEPGTEHNSFNNPSPQTTRLIEVLQDLEGNIKRQNSLKYTFLKGMIYGLGTVIGATVLVAIFGGILATTTDFFKIEGVPTIQSEQ